MFQIILIMSKSIWNFFFKKKKKKKKKITMRVYTPILRSKKKKKKKNYDESIEAYSKVKVVLVLCKISIKDIKRFFSLFSVLCIAELLFSLVIILS
jgi:hypothetical protein